MPGSHFLEPQRELRRKLAQYGNYLELREVLTALVKILDEFIETIVDTGGARSVMPLKLALHKYPHLVEPISDLVELVLPDGTFMTGLTHKVTIPITAVSTLDNTSIKIRKRNVTFLLGANVPCVSLSRSAIEQLKLWDSLKTLSKASVEPGLAVKLPMYANIPCYLSKWNALRNVHNDEDHGHGGEQRTYALAQKEFPMLGITRNDVKEFIKY